MKTKTILLMSSMLLTIAGARAAGIHYPDA